MTWNKDGWTEYPCEGAGLPPLMHALGRHLYESWAECGSPIPARVFIRRDELRVERTLEDGTEVYTNVVVEDNGDRLRIWDGGFGEVRWLEVGDPSACEKLFQAVVASLASAALEVRYPDPDLPG